MLLSNAKTNFFPFGFSNYAPVFKNLVIDALSAWL
jgi:hypothetical protein